MLLSGKNPTANQCYANWGRHFLIDLSSDSCIRLEERLEETDDDNDMSDDMSGDVP